MYLRDYLNDIPLKALKGIAEALDVSVEYRARMKLVNAIDRIFWDDSRVPEFLNGLDTNTLSVLSYIVFSFDAGVAESALIDRASTAHSMDREDVIGAINTLVPLALTGTFEGDAPLYFCPRGPAEQVRRYVLRSAGVVTEKEGNAPSAAPLNLVEDIYSLLAEAYKNGIPLTLMEKVKKKALERIFDGSLTCGKTPFGLTVKTRSKLVFGYLEHRGLVHRNNRMITHTPRIDDWLCLSMTERLHDIASFCITTLLKEHYAIRAFVGIVSELPTGGLFNPDAAATFIENATMAGSRTPHLRGGVHECVAALTQMGLFAAMDDGVVMTGAGEALFKDKSAPIDETLSTAFTIQPNFEIIIGQELEPRLRFQLELLADRKSRDVITTYDPTAKSISRARERGMSVDSIITFFTDHARNTIPQNIRYSIETWARAYGNIYFEEAMLLRFRDGALGKEIMHRPEIEPYIHEIISDTTCTVNKEHAGTIHHLLKEAGYQPENPITPTADCDTRKSPFTPVRLQTLLGDVLIYPEDPSFQFPDHLYNEELT